MSSLRSLILVGIGGLVGSLPPTLCDPPQLEELVIMQGTIERAPFPSWLTRCANLKRLQLQTLKIEGALPDLRALTQLETLKLADNLLVGPLPPLPPLLHTLDISSNQISDFSAACNCSQLSSLW